MITNVCCERQRAHRSAGALLTTALLLFSFDGHAQQTSTDDVARLRSEAALAASQNRLADAFKTLTLVYAATHAFSDACNAGRTAYRMGKLSEAHRYLSDCEALGRQVNPSELGAQERRTLKEVRNELALVRTQIARLTVYVNKPGAEVFVDGAKVGMTPLQKEIGLEPGHHRVKAALGDASTEQEHDIPAGELRAVEFYLQTPTAPPPLAAPGATAPQTTPVAESEPAESSPEKPALPRAPLPAPPPSSPRAWPGVLVVVAGGVALLGAGFALGGYLGAESAARDVGRYNATVVTKGCRTRALACDETRDAWQSFETARSIGGTGFTASMATGALLLSASALGYWTDPARRAPTTDGSARTMPVKIEAAPTMGGLVIRGIF